MSQIKMRPPVGVLKGTGKGGYEFYMDSDTGRAMVDPDSVATLIAAGWTVDLDGEAGSIRFIANAAALPATGEALNVYVALDTGVMYRWTGSAYLAFTFGVGTDASGNTVLVGADGSSVLRGPMVSGIWFTSPSVFRLRLTGTGTVQFDSRDSAGTVTAVATYTLTGATDQIEFPYAGDNAVAIRATLTGTATAEVI